MRKSHCASGWQIKEKGFPLLQILYLGRCPTIFGLTFLMRYRLHPLTTKKNATYEIYIYIHIVTQKKTEKVQCITILVGFYQLLSFWFWGLLYCASFNLCIDIVGCSWGQEQDRTKGGEANATPRERGHWVGSLQTGFGKQSKEARTIGDIPYRCISSIVIYIYVYYT
jgi:hypothetical protein